MLTAMISISLLLVIALLATMFCLKANCDDEGLEKSLPFECGFNPVSDMRTSFSTRYFVLVLLFLIFDVEVALLFPMLMALHFSHSTSLMIFGMMFIAVLIGGLIHEWNEGLIDWMTT